MWLFVIRVYNKYWISKIATILYINGPKFTTNESESVVPGSESDFY